MLANGFEEIEALTVVDILRRGEIDVQTVAVYNNEYVTGAHGINIKSDIMLSDIIDDYTVIVLPGGMPGTINLQNCEDLQKLIIKAHNNNKLLAAICAAPMIFGELKLLEGKKATCYPGFEKHLLNAEVLENKVCYDGNIITSRGAGTAADFAFKILEVIKNKEISEKIRSSMIYD